MPSAFYLLLFPLFGLLFGSFANVLILRDDRRLSIVTGRSECPNCKHLLRWYELLPVLSYIGLRGRCSSCHKPISAQYPLVELVNALLWYFAAGFGVVQHGSLVLGLLLACSLTVFLVISVIDLRTQMVALEYCIAAAVLGGLAVLLGHLLTTTQVLLGMLVGGGSIALILYTWKLLTHQDGMGEGDIWIGAAVGAAVGYPLVGAALLSAVVIGAIVGMIYAGILKQGLKIKMPFGPFLAVGIVVALLWGQGIVDWYILQI